MRFGNLADVIVPIAFSENFLVCDDGDEEKILIFSSKIARQIISGTRHPSGAYFGDGTFKSVPPPIYQLYTVHLDLGFNYATTNIAPVIYGLLPNKSQETYKRFFSMIKEKLNFNGFF